MEMEGAPWQGRMDVTLFQEGTSCLPGTERGQRPLLLGTEGGTTRPPEMARLPKTVVLEGRQRPNTEC